jgi:hypothetical protein
MIIREAGTAGRIAVKPHINALGEREDRIWTEPTRDSRKSVLSLSEGSFF